MTLNSLVGYLLSNCSKKSKRRRFDSALKMRKFRSISTSVFLNHLDSDHDIDAQATSFTDAARQTCPLYPPDYCMKPSFCTPSPSQQLTVWRAARI